MPFADEFLGTMRSRGMSEAWSVIKRAVSPAGSVMRDMGPVTGKLAQDLSMIEDETAEGVGRYIADTLPLETWERINPEKRIIAGEIQSGWIRPEEVEFAMRDPEVAEMVNAMRSTFERTNAENLAATDHLGESLKVRNPFTGEWRPYEGISGSYFPRFVKRSKRDAILDPMQYAQSQLERRFAREYSTGLGLDADAILDPEKADEFRQMASDAIDDFFRTGQPNDIIRDSKIVKALTPARETFQELYSHMRDLAVRQAAREGREVPPELDPIIALFGSDDPTAHRSGIKMLREFLLRDAQNARRFGSIESSRALPLPRDWYENDPMRVLPVYLMRQQRRLAEIKRFGQNNEAILDPANGVLSQIVDEGDRTFAKSVFERAMGLEPYNKSLKASNLMDWIFASQVIKLGTAQISQLGQVMNAIMETGLGPTWSALTQLGKSKEIAMRSGASLTRVMDIVREGLADPLQENAPRKFSEGFLKWTGFNKADLVARYVGAGAGYAHGQELFRRIIQNPQDIKTLRELRRLTPGAMKDNNLFKPVMDKIIAVRQKTGGRITYEQVEKEFQDELDKIARTASLNANFRQSILDTPLWASSPLGRLIMMFRTFAYKQTRFLGQRAYQDWKAGNPRTLIGLAAGAGLLGPAIATLKSLPQGRSGEELKEQGEFFSGQQPPTELSRKAIENLATVGGFGLFDQFARAMRKGDNGWFEFMFGPLFTDIARLFGGTGQIVAGATGLGEPELIGRGEKALGRFLAGRVPVVGGSLGQAVRTLGEPVVRHESGLVTRGLRQALGTEEPPVEIGGFTLPSPSILFGFEQSAFAKRGKYLDEIKKAIASGDRDELSRIIREAKEEGINISATSIKRLFREYAMKQREENV